MTQQTLDNNKLIAEFMGSTGGFYHFQNYDTDLVYGTKALEFHESWNWLMPVVEECMCPNNALGDYEQYLSAIQDSFWTVNIKEVYKAVIDFIKWRNNQKG